MASFFLPEKQIVRTDAERYGDVPNYVERGLRAAALVAAQLHHMNADAFGECLLSESAGFSDLGKACWEACAGTLIGGGSFRCGHATKIRPHSRYVDLSREHM